MSPTIAQRGPAIRLRTLSVAAIGTAVVATGAAVVPRLMAKDESLPAVVGARAPWSYSITYRVTAGEARTTEVLRVRRPFDSRLVVHEGDSTTGRVLSQRASIIGRLLTSSGGPWSRLVVPPALATADLRPEMTLPDAVGAGLVDDLGDDEVGGRVCRRYALATTVAGGTLQPQAKGERAEVCIDAVGLVLSERWVIDGEVVRTKRAVALDTEARVPSVPTGATLVGNGSLRRLRADAPVPFSRSVSIGGVPEGFTHQFRYAVVPPSTDVARDPAEQPQPKIAAITDVWVRGADVLILDQGATKGPDPFAESKVAAPVDLGVAGLDRALLVLDLRANEVRIRLDDGGFIRLAGTLTPDALMRVARSLRLTGGSDG